MTSLSTTASPLVSIIVPTFNEASNVSRLVALLDQALDERAWEVVFIDDDSPDRTWKFVQEIARQDRRVRSLRRIGRRGLAGACIEGMLSSAAPYIAVMDADLQHDEAILPLMFGILERDEADIVVGSRYIHGDAAAAGFSDGRAFASRLATALAAIVIGKNVSDPMSGFFAIRRDTFEGVAPRLLPSEFKILLDILASADPPPRVKEVAYRFRARQQGQSKFNSRAMLDFLSLLTHR